MKNYLQTGNSVILPAPADVVSGELVIVGALPGVAVASAATGESVTLATAGVFELGKRLSATFSPGGAVSYDVSARRCDAPGPGRYPIGTAMKAAGNGTATVPVRLDGVATAAA